MQRGFFVTPLKYTFHILYIKACKLPNKLQTLFYCYKANSQECQEQGNL